MNNHLKQTIDETSYSEHMDSFLSRIDPDILAVRSEVEDYNDLLKSWNISDNDVINMMSKGIYFNQEENKESLCILRRQDVYACYSRAV